MSATHITAALRRLVWQRAAGCCEYCRIHESEVLLPHEADHVIAEQHGGRTNETNLAVACFQCNKLKGPNLSAVELVTGGIELLFHPRLHEWRERQVQQRVCTRNWISPETILSRSERRQCSAWQSLPDRQSLTTAH